MLKTHHFYYLINLEAKPAEEMQYFYTHLDKIITIMIINSHFKNPKCSLTEETVRLYNKLLYCMFLHEIYIQGLRGPS